MKAFINQIIKPLLGFLVAVAVIVAAVLVFVFLLSLLFHGIPWVWNL